MSTVRIIQIQRDTLSTSKPGTWCGPMRCEDGHLTAHIRCPNCGHFFSLSKHTISDDGTVMPSVVCPWQECQPQPWHEFIILADWAPAGSADRGGNA